MFKKKKTQKLLSAIKLYIQKCLFPVNGWNDLPHNMLLFPPINYVSLFSLVIYVGCTEVLKAFKRNFSKSIVPVDICQCVSRGDLMPHWGWNLLRFKHDRSRSSRARKSTKVNWRNLHFRTSTERTSYFCWFGWQVPSEAAHKLQLPGDLHSSAGRQTPPALWQELSGLANGLLSVQELPLQPLALLMNIQLFCIHFSEFKGPVCKI